MSSNFPHLLAMPPTLITPADVTESTSKDSFALLCTKPPVPDTFTMVRRVRACGREETSKKDRGEEDVPGRQKSAVLCLLRCLAALEEEDTPQSKAKRLSITFGASHDETRREHARSLRSSNASHDKLKQTALQVCMRPCSCAESYRRL